MAGRAGARHAFNRGLIQGCSSSPCLWNHLLAYLLAPLLASWQAKGLGVRTTGGVWWGLFSYADDLWLLARNVVDLQVMLDDLVRLFKQAGLHFSETKSQWWSVQPLDHEELYLDGLLVPKTDTLMCLGFPIAARSRSKIILQALRVRLWRTFWTHALLLRNRGIAAKLRLQWSMALFHNVLS
eukprot:2911368-Amphidinium_carterae.2